MTLAEERLSQYNDVLYVTMKFEDGKYHRLPVWKIIEAFLKIRNDKGELVPFILNKDQVELYESICEDIKNHKPIRKDILKARQLGFSTFIAAIIFVLTAFQMDKSAVIIADQSDSASHIFDIYKTFYDALPEEVKQWIPKSNKNAYELSFDYGNGHKSSIRVLTQGDTAGRGFTVQYVHISECAFFKDLHMTLVSLMQSIASNSEMSMMFLETTANGYNEYKQKWDEDCAKKTFDAKFYPWFTKPDYAHPYVKHDLLPFEREAMDKYHLSLEQVQWYRDKWEELGEDLDMLRQEHPSNPVEAFMTSGSSVFNKDLLAQRKEEIYNSEPLRKGYFAYEMEKNGGLVEIKNDKFIKTPNGSVSIYEEPIEGHPYVICCDPSAGGNDYWAVQVFDNSNLHQVACYHQNRCDRDEATYQTVCLCHLYKRVMLTGEINTPVGFLELANDCGISNIYHYLDETDPDGRYQSRFGYKTTQENRQSMILMFVEAFRDNPKIINDLETICEMETFSYYETTVLKKEKAMADPGKHDDLVMACAGFFLCRNMMSSLVDKKTEEEKAMGYDPLSVDKPKEEGRYMQW